MAVAPGRRGRVGGIRASVETLDRSRPPFPDFIKQRRRQPRVSAQGGDDMMVPAYTMRTTMPKTPFPRRLLRFKALPALVVAVSLATSNSVAAASGAFEKFIGSWSGA